MSDEKRCEKCGSPISYNSSKYYRCGVRSCHYESLATSKIYNENVKECPKCKNDTLILHNESENRCTNPKCGATTTSVSQGGYCYVATLALPTGDPGLALLRDYRDRHLHRPWFATLVSGYYAAQPVLGLVPVSGLTRKFIGISVNAIDRHRRFGGRMAKYLAQAVSCMAFVLAFICQVMTVFKQKMVKK